MRPNYFHHLVAVVALALTSVPRNVCAAESKSNPSAVTSTSGNTNLVGVWEEDQNRTWIELRADGDYEWWAPHSKSDLTAKSMIQSGKWSVHNQTLTFHIEKAFLGQGAPGTQFHYDLISVSSEKVLLLSPLENREITWSRVFQQNEPFWKVAISYQSPFEMHSYLNETNTAPFPGDWELSVRAVHARTNADAKVVFHLGAVADFVQPEKPKNPIVTIADLKHFVDSQLQSEPRGSNAIISITKIDNRDALMCNSTINPNRQGPPELECRVCFFWQTNAVWEKSTLCSITLTAQKKDTLDLLKDSLKSVKVLPESDKH